MKNKIALSSLAMDLRRVALGYHRGSVRVADQFYKEALLRRKEIDLQMLQPYLQKLFQEFDNFDNTNAARRAEDALLYSILFQNAAVYMK